MRHQKKIAIVLFNLGGPDKMSSVKPFLFNLFNDSAIINLPQPFRFLLAKFISSRREKKSQNIYKQIGVLNVKGVMNLSSENYLKT